MLPGGPGQGRGHPIAFLAALARNHATISGVNGIVRLLLLPSPTTSSFPTSALRFSRFLAVLTLESFSAQALGLAVGAAAPSTEAALAIGPAAMLISIVFGGLFVNEANVPRVLSWLPKTSIIKYVSMGLACCGWKGWVR